MLSAQNDQLQVHLLALEVSEKTSSLNLYWGVFSELIKPEQ